jgi:hypothetical protein
MKSKLLALASITLALTLAPLAPVAAQHADSQDTTNATASGSTRTDSRIVYHNGPVLTGTQVIYAIWYGYWANDVETQLIVADFISDLGSSVYFQINTGYPNGGGTAPNGALTLGGGALDAYSHSASLTQADVADVVANAILTGGVPLDPSAIYVVLTSPDVTVTDAATQFCLTCCNLHGDSVVNGSAFRYVFVGHPRRCPGACAAQFSNKQSPNGNYAADAMAAWLAHALNAVVTNPTGSGWYDRYGLENSEKCEGTFGTTYPVTNHWGEPAEANIRLGYRNYLLQQNWVNGKKGHCALSYLQ